MLGQLPQRVLHDLGRRGTESAQLWNQIYARATPHIDLSELLALPQLWGSAIEPIDDQLEPYYWGFNLAGQRLPELDAASAAVDGAGHATEVDLFLLGSSEVVLIEAKGNASPGRCARYGSGRCPEIHDLGDGGGSAEGPLILDPGAGTARSRNQSSELDPAGALETITCRYWEVEAARFSRWLEFGARPDSETVSPPCDRHYQLARSLVLGQQLADRLQRRMHLWLLLPEHRWPQLERTWLDFVDRVKPADIWRRMRVISWAALRTVGPR